MHEIVDTETRQELARVGLEALPIVRACCECRYCSDRRSVAPYCLAVGGVDCARRNPRGDCTLWRPVASTDVSTYTPARVPARVHVAVQIAALVMILVAPLVVLVAMVLR